MERSATITLASDYLFNGITQTDEGPALQGSIDFSLESGVYFGSWASNVDFGDDTNLEVDFYGGYYGEFENGGWYDVSLLYYSYHGGSGSDDSNYFEVAAAMGTDNLEVKVWYAPDYAGTGARHIITALSYSYPVTENASLVVAVDRSESLDYEEFEWEPGDESYIHWRIGSEFSLSGFDASITLEGTDLDTYGDTRLLATISKTFSF
ncbi:TorF family putative porin [Planctobacterium marinum]|uniref:TIGR02001 family outer membrane protein n=1 Tax=Planctobacterium marinum TaxID=1631968 RepID=A0AA48HNP5_9ALTE|nr:TIGR02001 family outer membrane protein [Planctobacterium marinum]